MFQLKKISSFLLPAILLIAGIYFLPLRIFNADFSKIPGDLGDARFNNYILEHGYQYFSGKVENYWDAPFMYPAKNVIAYSDNLLGTVPLYSLFRLSGSDRETAFQLWFISLFILNFICCFWALKNWSGNYGLAAAGAYIFAFSIYNLGQINHAQVFPKFIIPLVFYWSWQFLKTKNKKYCLLTALGIVYQFYCGIYLGLLLLYALLFMFAAYAIVFKEWHFFQIRNIKLILFETGCIFIAGLLLIPLMLPYIRITETTGMRSFSEVVETIPTLRSYFFPSPLSDTWEILHSYSNLKFSSWWFHTLMPGIIPWAGLLLVPVVLFISTINREEKKFIIFLMVAFSLSILFCLNIYGFTLYRFIFELPGFSSMRSLDRIINIQIVYFILLLVFGVKALTQNLRFAKYIPTILAVFILFDNRIKPSIEYSGFDKNDSQEKISGIAGTIMKQFDKKHNAIAFLPVVNKSANGNVIDTHLDIMLASQSLGIACVNGYSGNYPPNFSQFFKNMDEETLRFWCKFNDSLLNKIQRINEFNKEIQRVPIWVKANNGKYISADPNNGDLLIANRDHRGEWETFLFILLENNECLIRSYNNRFLSGIKDSSIAFLTEYPEETMTIIPLGDRVAFKNSDNKFLSLQKETLFVSFSADSVGPNELYELVKEYFPEKKERSRSVINIRSGNNKILSADESEGNIIKANRNKTGPWEAFLFIRYENNECVLRSNSRHFLAVDINNGYAVSAYVTVPGVNEIVTILDLGNDNVAFKAFNGRYFSVNKSTSQIFANSDSIGINETFKVTVQK